MTRTTLAAAMVLACSILLSSGAIAQGPQLPPGSPPRDRATGHATDVVLVKFREAVRITNSRGAPATGKVELDRLLSDQGVQQADRLMPGGQGPYVSSAKTFGLDRIYRLRLASGRDPVEVVAALAADPGVEYAEPDFRATAVDAPEAPQSFAAASAPAATAPNDPFYADQWGLAAINAATAWEVVTGTPAIVIAVVDSGIDTNHEDLMPNLWVNPGEIGNGIDDDNNGYVDDIQGWNFVSGSNDVQDGWGHGTQVAGVAAAATNNGLGIAGLCGNCRIMPVKVMADSGVANYSDIAAGVAYAAAKGASIINLSLGGYADSRTLRDAIAAAVAQGIVVVAGAGNDGLSTPFYPAAYPNVLAVAATTVSDTLAASSNRGAWISVAAPGVDITTTYLGGGYGAASGTSMAAPLASGLAGLIRSRWPAWTEAMVRSQIRQTAGNIDTLNPGYEGQMGQGRINAAAAMQDPYPVLTVSGIAVNGDPLGRPTPGQTATLAVTLRNDWWDATATTASLSTADSYVTLFSNSSSFGPIASGATAVGTPVYSFTVASGAGYNHPIAFTLAVTANAGTYAATFPLTVTTRSSEEMISATITNSVWTRDKTYVVNSNVDVAAGYTLTIQPGTEVRLSGNYTLRVGGTLIADGTADQPIVFRPYTPGGVWNRIYFMSGSLDIVDPEGNYQAGTILRHVKVLSATSGLVCAGGTPYLSHVTTNGGGINCKMGYDFWLLDSDIRGDVSARGHSHVWRTRTTGGGVALGSQSEVLTSTIGGGVALGDGSVVRASTIGDGIAISGNGTIAGNVITGSISQSSGEVANNMVTSGNVNVGSGQILTNTVRRGGLVAGSDALIAGNDVENAPGTGIEASGTASAIGNRVVASGGTGVVASAGLVQGNLIANGSGVGLDIGSATVVSNTLTGNRGSAIRISSGTPGPISGNNLEGNKGLYDIENTVLETSLPSVNAAGNWWGTTDTAAIATRIYDYWDAPSQGEVAFPPVLGDPVESAPAYVRAITMTPESPVGNQTVQYAIVFSRQMDTSTPPEASALWSLSYSWTQRAPLPTNRHSLAAAVTGSGRIYAVGGVSAQFSAVLEEYDPDLNTWISRAPMPMPRSGHGAAMGANGKLYVIGGYRAPAGGSGAVVGLVEEYDPGANTWQVRTPMPTSRVYPAVVATADGKILVIGGEIYADTTYWLCTVEQYDPVTDVWTTKTPMPTCRGQLAAVTLDNGHVLAIGGLKSMFDGGTLRTVEEYDPQTDTWTERAPMPTARRGLSAVATATGKVYAVGGGGLYTTLGAVEEYDPRADTWTARSPMPTPRVFLAATASTDDGLYAIGGNNSGAAPVTTVEHMVVPYEAALGASTWLSGLTARSTYGISTLVPRGPYTLTVSGAVGTDGMEIASYSGFTFTVAEAGGVTDKTPPAAPIVSVDMCRNSTTSAAASWSATDAESGINLYSYSLGTSASGTEVVNWTTTPLTTVVRSGLNLLAGQRYYFSVKARNMAGLWSPAASAPFLAGLECQRVYLPLVLRGN
jgi:subtilisin family serine protease/N-acetylneuraminic acid mutarotase